MTKRKARTIASGEVRPQVFGVSPLRRYRLMALQMSAQALADAVQAHKTTLCRLEVGTSDHMPSKAMLARLLDYLDRAKPIKGSSCAKPTLEEIIFPERNPCFIKHAD